MQWAGGKTRKDFKVGSDVIRFVDLRKSPSGYRIENELG